MQVLEVTVDIFAHMCGVGMFYGRKINNVQKITRYCVETKTPEDYKIPIGQFKEMMGELVAC